MTTFKVYTQKPYEHIIKAVDEKTVKLIMAKEYPTLIISNIVNCSPETYQLSYDNEQFDSNGRKRF